ncbi:protein PTHB1-like [Branchiostoma lanceolatum]|uniref:protein PTHB1-like n=1 Tax=Branchiostoma lanceolatum TaxID=7740 RepID=UPI00345137EF
MSLFKTRDWWSARCQEETFDQGCLCVANIDNSPNAHDKVLIGSFAGVLRAYLPRPGKGEGFKPEDLLLEVQLNSPILQLEAGRFVSGTEALHLAVLHPRKVAVYGISLVSGAVEHGSHYQLNMMYEHNLQRTACNMAYGPFGGVKGKDFLCIQSMDGTLSIFEQESFAFSRFLPGFLLPGPLKYITRTDSFITVSALRQVESYKYQVLAVATDSNSKEESQKISSGKRVTIDWSLNIGEQAVDVTFVSFPQAPPSILVLGEHSLFCVKETGQLRFMKKLEYNPCAFLPFAATQDGVINTIICTHTNQLLVYGDVTLKWAAQLQHVPVAVKVATFPELKGVIATLSEDGHLNCSYLGTDPAMFIAPAPESRDINYDAQDEEMEDMKKRIAQASQKGDILPQKKSEDELTITASVSPSLDPVSKAMNVEMQDENVPSITAELTLKSKMQVENVHMTIRGYGSLGSTQTTFKFSYLDPSSPPVVPVSFYLEGTYPPASLSAEVSASYNIPTGAPRTVQATVSLPLSLVCRPCVPVKNAVCKVTIDTNKPPVNLNEIFPDLSGDYEGSSGYALGFELIGGPIITVLASKTSQKYRVQCDQFDALWLVVKELVDRLTRHHKRRGASDFRCSFVGGLPLQEYFEIIDSHFELRSQTEHLKKVLQQRASQFRSIQRRLLTRFKDKTPAPLQNLDALLEGTFRQILAVGEACEENTRSLRRAGNAVSAATRLMNMLIRLSFGMSDREFAVLEASLTAQVDDDGEIGWEEIVDAAITHLLRTCLAKSSKDSVTNPPALGIAKDTGKLKKHLSLLVDRLSKGGSLAMEGVPGLEVKESESKPVAVKVKTSPRNNVNPEPILEQNMEPGEVPVGSKLGEQKNRKLAPMSPRNGGGGLKPLGESGSLPPLDMKGSLGSLPPLGGKKLNDGLNDLSKNSVPDLDDLPMPPTHKVRNDIQWEEEV